MSFEQLLAFTAFAIVTTITPGPNNIMLTATGANVGVRRGMPLMFGILVGFSLMLFLLLAVTGTALAEHPSLLLALKVAGTAVLLWLAWKIATAGRAGPAKSGRPIGFLGGAAFQWVNPKAWLIAAGSVSFLTPDGWDAAWQAAAFAAIEIVTGAPCMLLWLGAGAAVQRLLRTDRALRIFNITMAALLVATLPLILMH